MKKIILISALASAFAMPIVAHADSTTVNPASTGSTATGKLNFTIVVPAVLYFRIGTGNGIGAVNATTPDTILFTVPATNLNDGTAVAGTGGDLNATTPGSVTVRLFSNVGNALGVSLNAAAGGALTSSGGNTIPWTEITIAPAALASTTSGYTNGSLVHPTLTAAGVGTAVTTLPTSKLVRQEAKWTFGYKNTAGSAVAAGSYGFGTGSNGVLTYTASQL